MTFLAPDRAYHWRSAPAVQPSAQRRLRICIPQRNGDALWSEPVEARHTASQSDHSTTIHVMT